MGCEWRSGFLCRSGGFPWWTGWWWPLYSRLPAFFQFQLKHYTLHHRVFDPPAGFACPLSRMSAGRRNVEAAPQNTGRVIPKEKSTWRTAM